MPLLVAWPGVTRAGSVCDLPVSGQDLFPTVLDIAGVSLKPESPWVIDGQSLVSLLRGEIRVARDALFWHYPHYSNQGGKPGSAVRRGDLKLIEHHKDGKSELYDLKRDIGERNDLAAARPEEVVRLHQRLVEWRRAVGAHMPRTNPAYGPETR